MKTLIRLKKLSILVVTASVLAGCATFSIDTPEEMAEIPSRVDRDYDYRAMTPHGVVVGVRTIRQGDNKQIPLASHEFWVEATRERMRTMGGYALLEEEEVVSSDGTRGTLLKFGRDLPGGSFYYWLTLYVTDKNLHLVDAAGERERFENAENVVKEALASYRVLR